MSDFIPRLACQINLTGGYTFVRSYSGSEDEELERLLASATKEALRSRRFHEESVPSQLDTVCSAFCDYSPRAKDDLGRSGIITGIAIRTNRGSELDYRAAEVALATLQEVRVSCLKANAPFDLSVLAVEAILSRLAISTFEGAAVSDRPAISDPLPAAEQPVSAEPAPVKTSPAKSRRWFGPQLVFNGVVAILLLLLLLQVYVLGGR